MSTETTATVPAKITNDCGSNVEVEFDATMPLSQLSDDTLCRLASDDFRHSSEADNIAWASDDEAVQKFLREMEVLHKYGYDGGYEVEVDSLAALEWLMVNRPDAYVRIAEELAR